MALSPELADFANEAEFIAKFVVPLMQRLGYSTVVNYHGARELGKDLLLGEIDRFGLPRFVGLQAKFLPSISQSDGHGLARDCEEAFAKPFTHPQTQKLGRISHFIFVNAGTFSPNCGEVIDGVLPSRFAGNFTLLDGPSLVSLDRWATIRRGDDIRATLDGLTIEIGYNERMWAASLSPMIDDFVARRDRPTKRIENLRDVAISGYIARPSPHHADLIANAQMYYHGISSVNEFLRVIRTGLMSVENLALTAMALRGAWENASKAAVAIRTVCSDYLSKLSPLLP